MSSWSLPKLVTEYRLFPFWVRSQTRATQVATRQSIIRVDPPKTIFLDFQDSLLCNHSNMPKSQLQQYDITYGLPNLVGKFLEGWLGTLNSGSLASTVLASVATALFVHIQEQMKFGDGESGNAISAVASTASGDALLMFAYLGIIVNCGAAITSFLISSRLLETPFHSARAYAESNDQARKDGVSGDTLNTLFREYLRWRSWYLFKLSWSFMLFFGIMCIFAELILYLWIVEPSIGIKIGVSLSSFFILLPLMAFGVGLFYSPDS